MPLHQITPEDKLLRRIILQPQFFKITPDGVRRPTSAAFKMRSGEDGLSVDILGLTTLEQAIATLDAIHLASALKQGVDIFMTDDKQLGRAASEAGLQAWSTHL